jgi:dynein intermediate chain
MDIVGSQNAHSLISISTDGRMCVWKLGMLSRPQETVELKAPSTAGSRPSRETGSSVSTTALSFPDGEVNTFFIGAENGSIYSANRHGSQVGISDGMQYDSHFGPVTSLHFHPSTGPTDFGDLFLSCSVDWTMRLNSTRQSKPLTTFETATDYMYDVNWSPTHPALFCSADGSGKLDLWNLCESTETPAVRTKASERALSRCTWSNNGRQIATGDSGGTLTIWNVSPDTADSRNEDWEKMHEVLKGNFSYGSSAADMEDVSGAEAEAPVEA